MTDKELDEKINFVADDFISWFDMYNTAHEDIGTELIMHGVLYGHALITLQVVSSLDECIGMFEKAEKFFLEKAKQFKDNEDGIADTTKMFIQTKLLRDQVGGTIQQLMKIYESSRGD